ncbi:MAG: hypothetical protein ACR2H3_09895 [Acidimicrobiales bacterium]
MLLLLTIFLVLVATITLVIGIFSDKLALIWVSIVASFAAALVLAALSQMSKRRAQADATTPVVSEPPSPSKASEPTADDTAEEPTTVIGTVGAGDRMPIAGYDALKVSEILPKLERLDLDQLELVAVHEEDNKNRTTVLSRIDELMDDIEGGAPVEPATEVAAASTSGGQSLPISGYDDLNVSDIIPLLEGLNADELEAVAVYEEDTKDRISILNAVDDRLDILEGIVADPAPAKKAPAKKSAKKSTAKKSTAKKAAKKSTAKKSTAKKSTAKKAAKKSTAKKSTAKKSTAKKAAKKATKKR